jgi:hypothetical protein
MPRNGFKVSVPRTGRVRAPNLDNGQLTRIGKKMVLAQLTRWTSGVNAYGQPAKPLSKKYLFIKKKLTGVSRPRRDNKLTGVLSSNYSLRRANEGIIRADATSRAAREHASRAEKHDSMIGFGPSDQVVVFDAAKVEFGKYLQRAWVPVSRG